MLVQLLQAILDKLKSNPYKAMYEAEVKKRQDAEGGLQDAQQEIAQATQIADAIKRLLDASG